MDLFDLTATVTIDTAPFEAALQQVQTSAQGIGSMLETALSRSRSIASSGGYAVGAAVAAGIQRGIQSGSGSLYASMQSLCASLVSTARKELGIASPSKVFAQVGRYMTEGLTEGLRDGLSDTRRALADGMQSLTETGTLQARLSSSAEVYTESRPAAQSSGDIEKLLAEYLPRLAEKQTSVVLDGRNFSAALAPDMDEALGRLRDMGV